MNRTEKNVDISAIKDRFGRMASAVLADFRGMNVESVNALRRKLSEVPGIEYKVVKNTLVSIATRDEKYGKDLAVYLSEPTAIAWSYEDPVAPARVIADFTKDNDKLKIKCGVLEGKVIDAQGVLALSKMPGKDQLRSQLLATFMAPAQQFVRLMAAAPTNFVYLLDARKRNLEDK